jgi:membrane-bound lytic murein transglycosylase D
VRRGENLSVIAHRYGVSIQKLLEWNHLHSRSLIRKGQRLRVRPGPDNSAMLRKGRRRSLAMGHFGRAQKVERELPRRHSSVAANSRHSGMRRHVVRRGETLYDLSKRYGVSLQDLAKANNVKVNYRVMAGERLFIPD